MVLHGSSVLNSDFLILWLFMMWKVISSKHARLQGLGTVLLTLYRLRLEIVCNVPDSYFFLFPLVPNLGTSAAAHFLRYCNLYSGISMMSSRYSVTKC